MFIGIDFGTSNSSAAIYDGKEVRLLTQKFGHEKLLMRDEFKNVAAGLAVEAYHKQ